MAKLSPAGEAALRELKRRRGALYVPHDPTPKQAAFLALKTFEALYGGAAGGGKSDALLMWLLEPVGTPGYSCIAFRRTFKDLALPGALMERSHQWLRGTDAHWNGIDKQWRFPKGEVLAFGYLDTDVDKYRYQSAEFQRVAFDELTQFPMASYRYLLSRIRRRVGVEIDMGARAGSNPGGIGHDWVKAYYVKPGDPSRPFVKALLQDNPHLDQEAYRAALARLDSTTRRQLEFGEWIRDEGGLIYPIAPNNLIPELPALDHRTCWGLGIDLGASEREATTALVLICWHPTLPGTWVVRSEIHAGMIPSSLAERVRAIDAEVGGLELITMDEGALGKGYGGELRQRWGIPVRPAEKANKLGYRKLLRGELEQGLVYFVEPQCEGVINEAGSLAWNAAGLDCEPGSGDHHTDALLYVWRGAKAHVHDPPETRVRPGQPGYADAEEAAMLQQERAAIQKRKRQPWWT